MKIALEVQSQYGLELHLLDWNKLAGLPHRPTVQDVQELFYPGLGPNIKPSSTTKRKRDFLINATDDAYFLFYQSVLSQLERRFIDIQALLKTTKQDGKLMSIVMSHVVQWINPEPKKVVDRDNNKPQLRKDLIPALRAKYGDEADDQSRTLQQAVLEHVRENVKDFNSTTLQQYLHEYPGTDDKAYSIRFKHEVWRKVLSIVTSFIGSSFQREYLTCPVLEVTGKIRPSTIAQTARDLICQIPDVANDPALQSTAASEQLLRLMQPLIAEWIAKQYVDISDDHSKDSQPFAADLAGQKHGAVTQALSSENSFSQEP